MEQLTGSKLEKEYVKAVYCLPVSCFFNLYAKYVMQNASWVKLKLESRLPEKYQ